MATNTTDPVMGLTIPTVGQEPGPAYASDISGDLTKIAEHTHTGASNTDGYQIPAAGLNINADISMQDHNLTNARSVRMQSQSGTLSGTGDVSCIYVDGGNLWFNNSTGTPVQITAGGAVDVTVAASYTIDAVSTNLTIPYTALYNIVNVNSSSSAVTITLPAANTVAGGRYFIIKDIQGSAATNNITIRTNGDTFNGGATSITISTPFQAVMVVGDGISVWGTYPFDKSAYEQGDGYLTFNGNTFATAPGIKMNGETCIYLGSNASIISYGTGQYGGIRNNGTLTSQGVIYHATGDNDYFASGSQFNLTAGAQAEFGAGSTVLMSQPPIFINTQIRTLVNSIINGFSYGAAGNWAPLYSGGLLCGVVGSTWVIPLIKVHNGATLSSISISFRVGSSHLPATGPSIQMLRVNAVTSVNSYMSNTNPTQYYSLPGNANAYYNNGNINTLTFTCNENNVIDNTTYEYILVLVDESGSGSAGGNTYYSPVCSFTNITSLGWSI